MKKIGIAIDNYKLDYYKEKLKQAGLRNFEITQLTKNCKFIGVFVLEADFSESQKKIHRVCTLAEIHFKQRN